MAMNEKIIVHGSIYMIYCNIFLFYKCFCPYFISLILIFLYSLFLSLSLSLYIYSWPFVPLQTSRVSMSGDLVAAVTTTFFITGR